MQARRLVSPTAGAPSLPDDQSDRTSVRTDAQTGYPSGRSYWSTVSLVHTYTRACGLNSRSTVRTSEPSILRSHESNLKIRRTVSRPFIDSRRTQHVLTTTRSVRAARTCLPISASRTYDHFIRAYIRPVSVFERMSSQPDMRFRLRVSRLRDQAGSRRPERMARKGSSPNPL